MTILQQLIYISIKIRRDRKIPFELEARKNLTVDEFLGSNWREGLENVEEVGIEL